MNMIGLVTWMSLWVCAASLTSLQSLLSGLESLNWLRRFEAFKDEMGKSYSSPVEEAKRFRIFVTNMKNREANHDFSGPGVFEDISDEEIDSEPPCAFPDDLEGIEETDMSHVTTPIPSELDWRKAGLVTEVKHQGHCGSCWAFAAIGVLETQYAKQWKKLVDFSEQELVDCARHSCKGWSPAKALEFLSKHKVANDDSYPYISGVSEKSYVCQMNRSFTEYPPHARPQHIQKVAPMNEEAMRKAVATIGPLACTFQEFQAFHRFNEGESVIFSDAGNCTATNKYHAITVVGYGSDPSKGGDYWIIKNSWGKDWNHGGYVLLPRGRNFCSIERYCVYATDLI